MSYSNIDGKDRSWLNKNKTIAVIYIKDSASHAHMMLMMIMMTYAFNRCLNSYVYTLVMKKTAGQFLKITITR